MPSARRSGATAAPRRNRGPRRTGPPDRFSSGRRTPSPPQPAVPPPAKAGPKLTGRGLILLIVAAMLVVSYASSLRAWLEQRSHVASLEASIAQRRAAVSALEEEILRWDDPAYVRAQARQRFGWVMPGEVGYRVIYEDGTPMGADDILPERPGAGDAVPTDWWSGLWGSVQAAGRPATEPPTGQRGGEGPLLRIGPGRREPPAAHNRTRQ